MYSIPLHIQQIRLDSKGIFWVFKRITLCPENVCCSVIADVSTDEAVYCIVKHLLLHSLFLIECFYAYF